MIRSVNTGALMVDYELQYKRVRNLNLRVENDGAVRVSAPGSVPPERADEFVKKNIGFIEKARERLKAKRPQPEPGSIYYLGKRYSFAVRPGETDRAFFEGDRFILQTARPGDEGHIRCMLDAYDRRLAQSLFPQVVAEMMRLMQPYGVAMPSVTPRRMTTRWGSCTMARGTIRLNTRLVHYPVECIRQVALHELCHFVHPDHSADFYALLTALMPDWRAYKALLDEESCERNPRT